MKFSALLLALGCAAGVLLQTSCERSEAQTPLAGKDLPAAPMIGAKCTVKLFGGSETSLSLTSPELSGVLASASTEWVCVKEGTTEHWIPKAHVLELKLTR